MASAKDISRLEEASVLPLRRARSTVEWLEEILEKAPKAPEQLPAAGQGKADPDRIATEPPVKARRAPIREWPEDDRPRERLIRSGPASLSDSELLAILIRTGDSRQNAMEQARTLLTAAGGLARLARMSAADLSRMEGLGPAKASTILAALALAPRLERSQLEDRPQVSSSETAFRILREHYTDPSREEIVTLLLDTKNRLLRSIHCARGNVGSVSLDPASLFREAVREGAAALVLSHSHPSGDPTPSSADRRFTDDAIAAGKTLSVRVLDHIVVAGPRYFSFLDEGMMG